MSSKLLCLARSAVLASTAALGLGAVAPAVAAPLTVDLIEQTSPLAGANFAWTFEVPTSFSSALITLTLDGDFNAMAEYADVSFDGFSLGRVLDGFSGNPDRDTPDLFDFARFDDPDTSSNAGAPVTGQATLQFADISDLVLDGVALFLVDTSDDVLSSPTTVSARIDFFDDAPLDPVQVPTPPAALLVAIGLLAAGAGRSRAR